MTNQEIFTALYNEVEKGHNAREARNQVYGMGKNKFFLFENDTVKELSKDECKQAWKGRDRKAVATKVLVETDNGGPAGMYVLTI